MLLCTRIRVPLACNSIDELPVSTIPFVFNLFIENILLEIQSLSFGSWNAFFLSSRELLFLPFTFGQ